MFLIGSGVSIPSGFPSTKEITNLVLSGENIIRHTDSRYYINPSPTELEQHFTNEQLSNVLSLFKVIMDIMGEYNKPETINYEILFYFVVQLSDFESGNSVNMALYPFYKEVKTKYHSMTGKQIRFIDLFAEAENYIRHIVWRKLQSVQVTNFDQLTFLSDALKDKAFGPLNVATLNHDLLIESYLDKLKIKLHDGFGKPINGVRYWENNFKNENNLLKIHGSINWVTLRVDKGNWFTQKVGIVLDGDIDHPKNKDGVLMRSQPPEPLILTGTFNKIGEYTGSIYSDVYSRFKSLLNHTNFLVVSGYSFGDKGINAAVTEWLFLNADHRIIVIHRDPKRLLNTDARRAIQRIANDIAPDNFISIPKMIQDTTWEDIKRALESS